MPEFLPPLLQQIFNGLSLGAVYALIAIGYSMVYGVVGLINFAHGDLYMIGAYIGLIALTLLGAFPGVPPWLAVGAALLFAAAVTACYGWTLERVAYLPLRHSPRLAPLITAIGMSIFLENYVQLGQGARDFSVPALIPGALRFFEDGDFPLTFSYARLVIIGVTLLLMLGLWLLISCTRIGRACRACAEDLRMATLLGIDTNRVIAFIFVLGAILAALGGVLIGQAVGKVNPLIGFIAGIKAFTAAVLGGIGSIPGAVLGGLLLGVVETIASAYLRTEYKDVVAFGLLILVLLFRPTGLLGRSSIEKV